MLPLLKNNQINVFVGYTIPHLDKQLHDRFLDYLSVSELKKHKSFHFKKDKDLYLQAHTMVRLVLSEYLSCTPDSLEFTVNTYGKPALKYYDIDLSFNLSHAKTAVALAVSNNNQLDLGIDIECSVDRGQVTDLASSFFSPDETALILKQSEKIQTEVFFKLWTLKESYIKAIGKGLSIDLGSFSFSSLEEGIKVSHYAEEEQFKRWDFFLTDAFDNYFLSVASRNHSTNTNCPQIKTYLYLPTQDCVDLPLNFITS